MKIKLPLPKKISTNAIYAGMHWTKRNDQKNLFRAVLLPILKRYNTLKFPVIHFHFYFKRNALDHSNVSYMAKLIEDCMIKAGMLKDDSPKYIDYISLKSHKIEKGSQEKNDYVILEIEELNK